MSMGLGVRGIMMLLAIGMVHAQTAGSPKATPDPWYSSSPRPRDFEARPLGKFTIELPKDWLIVPGHGSVLFTAAERLRNNQSAAAIVLEQMQLQGSVQPKDVTGTLAEA